MKKRKIILSLAVTTLISLGVLSTNTMAATNDEMEIGIQGNGIEVGITEEKQTRTAITLRKEVQKISLGKSIISVTDLTGTQAPTKVYLQATKFTEIRNSGFSGNPLTLPEGTITLSDNTRLDAGSPVLVLDQTYSDPNTFNAEFTREVEKFVNITPHVKSVDLTNYPDQATPYESTMTVTLVQGP